VSCCEAEVIAKGPKLHSIAQLELGSPNSKRMLMSLTPTSPNTSFFKNTQNRDGEVRQRSHLEINSKVIDVISTKQFSEAKKKNKISSKSSLIYKYPV